MLLGLGLLFGRCKQSLSSLSKYVGIHIIGSMQLLAPHADVSTVCTNLGFAAMLAHLVSNAKINHAVIL